MMVAAAGGAPGRGRAPAAIGTHVFGAPDRRTGTVGRMARAALITRAVGFVLVALGLVALTAGPSIVDMRSIQFVPGIPTATAVDAVPASATGGNAVPILAAALRGTALPFSSAPPMPPRRPVVHQRLTMASMLLVLLALAAGVGARGPCSTGRRPAARAACGSARSGALRRLRRRAPPRLLV
jgi:hypothetical protein